MFARWLAVLAVTASVSLVFGCGASEESREEGFRSGVPSETVLSLHELRIPRGAKQVKYSVDDGWSSYALHVTFDVQRKEAFVFLDTLGVARKGLMKGFYLPEGKSIGWGAKKGRKYMHGATDGNRTTGDLPTYSVVLDITDSSRTTVYLSSVMVA